jgi:2-iminobutanoate/2-iminopropanoate deaminase
MCPSVHTYTPPGAPAPIGPYNHIARAGDVIVIGGVAGIDPSSGELAGSDVGSQTRQILESLKMMLASVGSDLGHVVHMNVFLKDMADFEAMNQAYAEGMGTHRPARTVVGVTDLPKVGARLTMNLTAVAAD